MTSKTAQLSHALRGAGFLDMRAFKQKVYSIRRRIYKTVPEEDRQEMLYDALKSFPSTHSSRGYFEKYADPRAEGQTRYKFVVRTQTPEDASEAEDIVMSIVPEANKGFSPSQTMLTISWTE